MSFLVELVVQVLVLVLALRNYCFPVISVPTLSIANYSSGIRGHRFVSVRTVDPILPPSPCLALVVKIDKEDPILNDLKSFQAYLLMEG